MPIRFWLQLVCAQDRVLACSRPCAARVLGVFLPTRRECLLGCLTGWSSKPRGCLKTVRGHAGPGVQGPGALSLFWGPHSLQDSGADKRPRSWSRFWRLSTVQRVDRRRTPPNWKQPAYDDKQKQELGQSSVEGLRILC